MKLHCKLTMQVNDSTLAVVCGRVVVVFPHRHVLGYVPLVLFIISVHLFIIANDK